MRSNGARLASARVEVFHVVVSGQEKIRYIGSCVVIMFVY